MQSTIKLLYPRTLPLHFAKMGRRMRLTVAIYLRMKAEYAAHSRFNDDEKGWSESAGACGYGIDYFRDTIFANLQAEKLAWRSGQYIQLASWDQFKKLIGYDRNYFTCHEQIEGPVSPRSIVRLLKIDFVRLTKADHERNFHFNINRNTPLKNSLENVVVHPTRENIAQCQLKAFTEGFSNGADMDEVDYSMYMLLKARKEARNGGKRFYMKADTHVSTQHISFLLGYKNKNGFCYDKKLAQQQGLIEVKRREFVIEKGLQTTKEDRRNSIGTVFFDHETRQTKLRMVDEINFLKVQSFRLPVPVPSEEEEARTQGNQTPLAA